MQLTSHNVFHIIAPNTSMQLAVPVYDTLSFT
jgi:hypothetical protein